MIGTIDYISSSFFPESSKEYRLSIREHSGGFSFCVLDLKADQVIGIKYIRGHNNVAQLSDEPFLNLDYKEVLYYSDGPFALVDGALESPELLKALLPIEPFRRHRIELKTCALTSDLNLIFDTHLFSNLVDIQQDRHPMQPLINLVLQETQLSCLVELLDESIYVCVGSAQGLQLANVFSCATHEDTAYYLMLIYQKLGLDVTTVPLIFLGQLDAEFDPRPYLKPYIRVFKSLAMSPKWNLEFSSDLYPLFASLLLN